MKAKRTGRILATLATFALAMGALVGIQAAQAATGANCTVRSTVNNAVCDVVTYGALHRVQSVDPINPIGGYTEGQMAYLIQGKLYRYDANGKPRRDLVEKADVSSDGKTVTHTLRAAKYSDGTNIVAADVVNAFERWVGSKRSASYIDAVDKAVAKDSRKGILQGSCCWWTNDD